MAVPLSTGVRRELDRFTAGGRKDASRDSLAAAHDFCLGSSVLCDGQGPWACCRRTMIVGGTCCAGGVYHTCFRRRETLSRK